LYKTLCFTNIYALDKDLTKLTTILKNKFNTKFDKLFSLKDKKLTKKDIELGKFALSNMLGGIG
jgi:hypothetical protein